ncbi:MAG: VOC family protein, partial [Rhodothermaceae bacterium]
MEIRSAVPELVTDNIGNTIEFYTKILGLKLVSEYPKENPQWVKFGTGSGFIMFETRKSIGRLIPEYNNKEKGGTFNLYFEVDNIEE